MLQAHAADDCDGHCEMCVKKDQQACEKCHQCMCPRACQMCEDSDEPDQSACEACGRCTNPALTQKKYKARAPEPVRALSQLQVEQCEPPTCRKGERACPDANDPNYCPICVAEDVPCAPLFACGKGKTHCPGTETCVPVGTQCDGGALTQQAAVAREANTKTTISENESKSNKTTASCSEWWGVMHAICDSLSDNNDNFLNIVVSKWEFKSLCCPSLPSYWADMDADCCANPATHESWDDFCDVMAGARVHCILNGWGNWR